MSRSIHNAVTILCLMALASPAAGQPVVEGHRGTGISDASNMFPENTLPSFMQAEQEGAASIELDVLQANDGALVVLHDDTLRRTTDGTGCAGDFSTQELKMLDAAVDTALEGTGVEIPTLVEALQSISVDVNIEIKTNDGDACPTTDRVAIAQAVAQAIASDTKDRQVMVSSFDSQVLELVAEQAPGVAVGLITIDPADAAVAETLGFDALHLFSLLVNDESAVADVHDRGLSLAVWTENDPFRIELLAELGVDKIITDDPDVANEVIDNLPEPGGGGCTAGGTSSATASLALLILLCWRRLCLPPKLKDSWSRSS